MKSRCVPTDFGRANFTHESLGVAAVKGSAGLLTLEVLRVVYFKMLAERIVLFNAVPVNAGSVQASASRGSAMIPSSVVTPSDIPQQWAGAVLLIHGCAKHWDPSAGCLQGALLVRSSSCTVWCLRGCSGSPPWL